MLYWTFSSIIKLLISSFYVFPACHLLVETSRGSSLSPAHPEPQPLVGKVKTHLGAIYMNAGFSENAQRFVPFDLAFTRSQR